ncbi:hypothetical protein [Actinomycetospora aeridis]|uniref:GAF domain-containing protein n=1 Tax=Actinomycetospora aeridis TaxID=3129231 RepID=A0ABU8N826_9PSEU
MTADRDIELGMVRARVRARIESSRTLIGRARTRAAGHDRDATVARAHARDHLGRMIISWIAVNGLATPTAADGSEDVLRLVLDATRALYDECSSISITTVDQLEGDARPYSTALGTGVAPSVDAAQYRFREGPCVDALEMDMVSAVRADDLTGRGDAERWPHLSRAADALGVRSALSIAVPWSALRCGLQVDQRAVGAINLYASAPRAFGQTEVQAMMLGAWAGSVMSGNEPAAVFHGTE